MIVGKLTRITVSIWKTFSTRHPRKGRPRVLTWVVCYKIAKLFVSLKRTTNCKCEESLAQSSISHENLIRSGRYSRERKPESVHQSGFITATMLSEVRSWTSINRRRVDKKWEATVYRKDGGRDDGGGGGCYSLLREFIGNNNNKFHIKTLRQMVTFFAFFVFFFCFG